MAEKEMFSGKTEAELRALIVEYKREAFNLRFQRAAGEMENTARFREVRRNVARANTALTALNKPQAA